MDIVDIYREVIHAKTQENGHLSVKWISFHTALWRSQQSLWLDDGLLFFRALTTLCWSHEICSIFSNNLRELTQGFHHKITIKYFMHYFCWLLCNFITFKIHLGVYDVCQEYMMSVRSLWCQESMMSGVCDVKLCFPPCCTTISFNFFYIGMHQEASKAVGFHMTFLKDLSVQNYFY